MLTIHIGRGKSGSTAIQSAIDASRDDLRASGIEVPPTPTAHHGNNARLFWAVSGDAEHEKALGELGAAVASPAAHVLTTSEFLFDVSPDGIERLIGLAGHRKLRVIAYVRDYASWMQSYYAQSTKTGKNPAPFSKLLRQTKFSALSSLERWGNRVGWPTLSIKTMTGGLVAGRRSLISDFSQAIGFDLPEPSRVNATPHWFSVELRREIGRKIGSIPPASDDGKFLRWLLETASDAAVRKQVPRIPYLSRAEATMLSDRFLHDINELSRMSGVAIAVGDLPPFAEHNEQPSLAAAPQMLLLEIADLCRAYNRPVSDATRDSAVEVLGR